MEYDSRTNKYNMYEQGSEASAVIAILYEEISVFYRHHKETKIPKISEIPMPA